MSTHRSDAKELTKITALKKFIKADYPITMDNFTFLKSKNSELYNIIVDAENLFRDEYFEQSMVQVRKFAENLCIDLLGEQLSECNTFDLIINKIKDNMGSNIRLNEFVEDLYFIKKNGNASAHTSNDNANTGENALECLERAFEISIFYMNEKFGYSKKIDSLLFNEELLMTGKVTKSKKSLKQKYVEELDKERNSQKIASKESQKTSGSKKPKTKQKDNSENKTLLVFFVATVLTLLICIVTFLIFKF